MMHTIIKLLKCGWLISQNVTHFLTLISRKLNKTANVEMRKNFQYFGSF